MFCWFDRPLAAAVEKLRPALPARERFRASARLNASGLSPRGSGARAAAPDFLFRRLRRRIRRA
jgi:hypothetical protein